MARTSAWNGNYIANTRPFVTLTPDVYVAFQGTTSIEGCGECKRTIDINSYVTSVSTDADVDSPPGSATIQLSIPDTDVTSFYNGKSFILGSMMEVEIFAKGYYTVGGAPRYYKIFWGLITSISTTWSNGMTSINISCKDILYWWQVTNLIINPSYVEARKTLAGGVSIWQNVLAGLNPYAVIIKLAKEATGDLSFTNFSYLAERPEWGNERQFARATLDATMAYWRAKFDKIWNNLVLFGASGQIYIPSTFDSKRTPQSISDAIIKDDAARLALTDSSKILNVSTRETAAYKKEIARIGVNVFVHQDESKLRIAGQAKDQIGYEFFCDPSGDIIFKPPFYNVNVLPNKPISWIQDFELIEDSITENSESVVTHLTSNGNAYGGIMDYGINDEVTTPYAGVFDYKLLKRFGWRRQDYPVEWAGNPRKLMYHLYDKLDQINARSLESGSMSIPMRPELRMGFPIYVTKYDAFFYITGISHEYSVGGTATTRINVCAKRSKFIAPKNIGTIKVSPTTTARTSPQSDSPGATPQPTTKSSAKVSFKVDLYGSDTPNYESEPDIKRDPATGKILGAANIVMVFRGTLSGEKLNKLASLDNARSARRPAVRNRAQKKKDAPTVETTLENTAEKEAQAANALKQKAQQLLRNNRYEAAATNAGAYDFVRDVDGYFQQLAVVPSSDISYSNSENVSDPANQTAISQRLREFEAKRLDLIVKRNSENDANAKQQYTMQLESLKTDEDDYRKNSSIQTKSIDKPTNIIVRPVSDEFGFEVIGHYKYGRGTFIDQGRTVVPDKINSQEGSSNNRLNIQFSPGIPDSEAIGSFKAVNVARSFEEMTAADWTTGYVNDLKDSSSMTRPLTYSVNANSNAGTSVFIEADLLRTSRLLSELTPTVANATIESAANNCSCNLTGRSDWRNIVPGAVRDLASSGGVDGFLTQVAERLREIFKDNLKANGERESKFSTYQPPVIAPTPNLQTAPAAPSLPPAIPDRPDPVLSNVNTVVNFSGDPIFQAVARGEFTAAQQVIQRNREQSAASQFFEQNAIATPPTTPSL